MKLKEHVISQNTHYRLSQTNVVLFTIGKFRFLYLNGALISSTWYIQQRLFVFMYKKKSTL